jgi:hypothetical protein
MYNTLPSFLKNVGHAKDRGKVNEICRCTKFAHPKKTTVQIKQWGRRIKGIHKTPMGKGKWEWREFIKEVQKIPLVIIAFHFFLNRKRGTFDRSLCVAMATGNPERQKTAAGKPMLFCCCWGHGKINWNEDEEEVKNRRRRRREQVNENGRNKERPSGIGNVDGLDRTIQMKND